MSAESLSALVERVAAAAPAGSTAPAGVAVCIDVGGAQRTTTIGWCDADGAKPLMATTNHDLASVTKVVTTVCLMALVSAETVRVDDDVTRFLPGSHEGITIRDLLLHRGGLWEWYPLYVAVEDPADLGAVHAFIDSLPPRYPRRQAHHYSDLGFMQLGRVVAAVAGAPLPDAVNELVAGPLGLRSLRFGGPADPGDVATSALDDAIEHTMLDTGEPYPVPFHSGDFAGWRTKPVTGTVNDGNAFHALGGVSGHAGLFADVGDLAKLAAALAASDEHDDLWAPPVVADFYAADPDAGQSLGFRRYTVPGSDLTVLGHTGFVGTGIGFVPERGIAVAMASNRLVTSGLPVATVDLWNGVLADTVNDVNGTAIEGGDDG